MVEPQKKVYIVINIDKVIYYEWLSKNSHEALSNKLLIEMYGVNSFKVYHWLSLSSVDYMRFTFI